MEVGIIGYGKQSKNIVEKLEKINFIKKISIFKKSNFDKNTKKFRLINNIKNLDKSKAIFIVSPNDTHTDYLKKFINTNKYIFCEKPAFTKSKDFDYLTNLSPLKKKKIFFNFNYQFSDYFKSLKNELKDKQNGKLINFSFFASHGQAFRNSKKKKESKNIFNKITGNLGIHYVNFLNNHIKNLKISKINEFSIAKKNFTDTCNIVLESKKISGNIFLSYASAHYKISIFHFTNSIVIFDNGIIKKYSPREYFNKKKLFITPPLKKKIISSSFIDKSLTSSLNFFINNVKKGKAFSEKSFNNSIKANKIFLNYNRQ